MKNPIADIPDYRTMRGGNQNQADSSMRIFYRNVYYERVKTQTFGFRITRNA